MYSEVQYSDDKLINHLLYRKLKWIDDATQTTFMIQICIESVNTHTRTHRVRLRHTPPRVHEEPVMAPRK